MKKDISYFDAETQKCIIELAREMAKDIVEKQYNKTWIVVKWQYKFRRDSSKTTEETPTSKVARRLYCPETDEYKEL